MVVRLAIDQKETVMIDNKHLVEKVDELLAEAARLQVEGVRCLNEAEAERLLAIRARLLAEAFRLWDEADRYEADRLSQDPNV